ncbi:translation protein SH3-like domain-containing protein [Pholiota molesta]|nr:translation protein SH3-like domain-containing protein [Pholiota molesta]
MLSRLRASASLLRPCLAPTAPPAPRTYATAIWKNSKATEVASALARSQALYKTYKPVSPGIRHLRRPLSPHLYPGRPLRSLTVAKRKHGGRNAHGVITVRHQGGGHRQRIRRIDYKRHAPGVHDVVRIEYDPNRSAHIALLYNRDPTAEADAKWSYIIATDGLRAGTRKAELSQQHEGEDGEYEEEQSRRDAAAAKAAEASNQSLALGLLRSLTLKPGNVLPLHLIPPGTVINTISLVPDGPGILVRSAGTFGQVIAHEDGGRYSQVRLQSGEVRKILRDCCATIGKVSNPLWKNRNLGKAGRARWLGIRPTVRGVAMNANDHPHGGGRGKSKSNKHPVSIWGWGTKGTRTRKPGPKGPKNSNKMVIRERPRGKEKQGLA